MSKNKKKSTHSTKPDAVAETAPLAESQGSLTPFWTTEAQRARELIASLAGERAWILFFFIAGLVTRFFQLTEADLWMDEIVILTEAAAGKFQTVSYGAHLVHLSPVQFFIGIFGENSFALRFWGALLGALAVPLTYLWSYLALGKNAGRLTALLVLFSPFLILYAQDGNYYGGMTFYTTVCLFAYVLFFRGLVYTMPVVLVVVGVLSYYNHPIAALPGVTMLGGMILGSLLFSDLRQRLYSIKPAEWVSRPALPLLVILLVIAAPSAMKTLPRIAGFLSSVITPGETTLTNVEVSWRLIRDHVASFAINAFRMGSLERAIAMIPFLFFLGGIASSLRLYRQRKDPSVLAIMGLAIVISLGSYFLIFSLQLDRNFNLRYFIYLVPLFLSMMAVSIAMLWSLGREEECFEFSPRNTLMALPLLIGFTATLHYFWADTGNYRGGVARLERLRSNEQLILPVRNDVVQASYYLDQSTLPSKGPGITYLNQPAYGDLYGTALPYIIHGRPAYFLSAWRYVEAPRMWDFLDELPRLYTGSSRVGLGHDLKIYHWSDELPMIFPRLASPGFEGKEILAVGQGSWTSPSGKTFASEGYQRSPFPNQMLQPNLAASEFYGVENIVSQPSHSKIFLNEELTEQLGAKVLRNERDDSYDFLVYTPTLEKRHLVLMALPLDPQDALWKENGKAVDGPLHLTLSVDSRHYGTWKVEGDPGTVVEIPINLDLEPGNHRLTISAFVPRDSYTPFFPWNFYGFQWNTGEAPNSLPSLEELDNRSLSSGWSEVPSAGSPGASPKGPYFWQGNYGVRIDSELVGPAGDPAVTVSFPGDERNGFILLGPPMPVIPGSTAIYHYYYRMEALEAHEVTNAVAFFGAKGEQVSFSVTNGPNVRGTTLGTGWMRRTVAVPVPESARILRPAFQVFPRKGETTVGTFSVASFHSPGTKGTFADPTLPSIYFPVQETNE